MEGDKQKRQGAEWYKWQLHLYRASQNLGAAEFSCMADLPCCSLILLIPFHFHLLYLCCQINSETSGFSWQNLENIGKRKLSRKFPMTLCYYQMVLVGFLYFGIHIQAYLGEFFFAGCCVQLCWICYVPSHFSLCNVFNFAIGLIYLEFFFQQGRVFK